MYKVARKKKDPVSWRKARFLRNRVELSIKTFKKEKIQEELIRNKTNPKKFWENVREIWPKDSVSPIHSLMDDNDMLLVNDLDIAYHINEYFSNIGEKLANIIRANGNGEQMSTQFVLNHNNDNITNIPITEIEFLTALELTDITKSSVIENVRAMVVIDAFRKQLERILQIYNGSLTHCMFPSSWKNGTVVPLPKISIPKKATDMRPISLLPLPGKILEHIISKTLKTYLEDSNILSEKQHGFRKKRSTLSAVVTFLHAIYTNIIIGLDSYIIYLDLKKAFDTVSHENLISKLKQIGLDQNTTEWFRSYLTNRKQLTKMNGVCSGKLPVNYGVPQGSILGPTLFSIYINDLEEIVDCDIVFYADDTVILGTDPTILMDNLEIIQKWCNTNLLTINCKKSQWMKTEILGKTDNNYHFSLDGVNLDRVFEYRYLGILIDHKLNFQTHREQLINNTNYKLAFFRII